MLMLLLSFTLSAFAKTDGCSLTEILKSDKPDKKCVEAYLAKIPNAEDRSEAKFRLAQWKPMKDLKVMTDDGVIEAYDGEKFLMRTILLQKEKPMVIYMDGKILVDASDNPSFARRLDNAMKKNKSAAFDFLLPRAYAQGTASPGQTQQTITMLYALDQPNTWTDAEGMVQSSQRIGEFMPSHSWLTKLVLGVNTVRCTSNNTIEKVQFNRDGDGTGLDTELQITQKSPTEFIITGLKRGKSHLIKLSTWESRIPHTDKTQPAMGFNSAADGATVSACEDSSCTSVSKTDRFEKWNFTTRMTPEEFKKFSDKSRKSSRITRDNLETLAGVERDYREQLIGKLFGISVMGNCCATERCREAMLKRFNIDLQNGAPAAGSSTTR